MLSLQSCFYNLHYIDFNLLLQIFRLIYQRETAGTSEVWDGAVHFCGSSGQKTSHDTAVISTFLKSYRGGHKIWRIAFSSRVSLHSIPEHSHHTQTAQDGEKKRTEKGWEEDRRSETEGVALFMSW